ncbi:MAG: glycosyltransferase family 2 protein [Acidobacteriota bacterium]
MKISVCIITHNEENRLPETLKSIEKIADEIIVVDSFSKDKTIEIAKSSGARIFLKEWADYSNQKNFAISKASFPWILSIDADERISEELRNEILTLKKTEPEEDGFFIKRKNYYLGKWIKHSGWYPDRKLRLFRKEKANWEGEYVHESLILRGKAGKLKNNILHYSYRNISDHVKRINSYSSLSAQKMFEERKKSNIILALFSIPLTFIRFYLLRGGIFDGIQGLIISILSSVYIFLKYVKLWEMNRTKNDKSPSH